MKIATPLKESYPLFPSNPSLKDEVLSSPPLFENLVGGSTPLLLVPQQKTRGGGGGCGGGGGGSFNPPPPPPQSRNRVKEHEI